MSFAPMLADRAGIAESDRERYVKRASAWIAVALVHVLILAALLTAGQFVPNSRIRERREVLLILPAFRPKAEAPLPPPPVPFEEPLAEPSTAITLPPPTPQPAKPQTDVMKEIGKELACGAGSFENLTQAQREACKREPWHFKKNARGVIVFDVTQPPPPDLDLSGAAQDEHTIQTADPCLAAGNTHSECIHKTLFGR